MSFLTGLSLGFHFHFHLLLLFPPLLLHFNVIIIIIIFIIIVITTALRHSFEVVHRRPEFVDRLRKVGVRNGRHQPRVLERLRGRHPPFWGKDKQLRDEVAAHGRDPRRDKLALVVLPSEDGRPEGKAGLLEEGEVPCHKGEHRDPKAPHVAGRAVLLALVDLWRGVVACAAVCLHQAHRGEHVRKAKVGNGDTESAVGVGFAQDVVRLYAV